MESRLLVFITSAPDQGREWALSDSSRRATSFEQCTSPGQCCVSDAEQVRVLRCSATQSLEDREAGVFTKTRRGTEEKKKKLQGHRVNVGDVKVMRIKDYASSGRRERTRKLEAVTRGRHGRQQLSTSSGDDDTALAQALGVAGGHKADDEARQRETSHNV